MKEDDLVVVDKGDKLISAIKKGGATVTPPPNLVSLRGCHSDAAVIAADCLISNF